MRWALLVSLPGQVWGPAPPLRLCCARLQISDIFKRDHGEVKPVLKVSACSRGL